MIQRTGSAAQAQTAIGILRIVAGVIFVAHGYQKFFIMGIPGVTGFFDQLGIPLAGIMAIVIATLELVGGFALLIGFFGRFIAVPLALDIAGAIFFFHAKGGFFVPKGIEFVMLLLASAIAIAIAGSGRFSVDSVLAGRTDRR
jgi:putative oxidoreductase